MKTVVLLRKPKASSANTGIGLYTDGVAKMLSEESIEYTEIEMRMTLQNGFMRMITDGFIRPFFKIMAVKKDTKIFHSADDFCCFFFPLLRKNKKIVTFHHVISDKDKDSRFLFSWKLVAWIGVRWADRIVAISNQTKEEILERYGVDDSKIVVISNKLSYDVRTLSVDKKKYIGCVSTLTSRKNLSSLLKAYSEFIASYNLNEYVLKICGKGPEEDNLKALAKELSIGDKVEFISDLTEEEIILFYNEAALIANPSLHEGFGRVTLEAQLCSTPVIYFKKAAIPEEVTRFAIPSEDEKEFAFNMYKLLTNDELYKKVTEEGMEYARSFQGEPKELLELYNELSS